MSNYQSKSNRQKAKAGKENFFEIKKVLKELEQKKIIKSFKEDVKASHKDFSYKSQFKADFLITTLDGKYILIRTSTSYRSDRVKTYLYDFLGFSLYSKFSENIVASILVFPNKELGNSAFINHREQVFQKRFFSPATHWLVKSEFLDYIRNYKDELIDIIEESKQQEESVFAISEEISSYESDKNLIIFDETIKKEKGKEGSYYGRVGFMLEKYLIDNLNDPVNLLSYKEGKKRCVEFDLIVDVVLGVNNLKKEEVIYIQATDSITRLKKLGLPKTDINARFNLLNREELIVNISVKNTAEKPVSCHDYQAEDFCRVVNPSDEDFCYAVNAFQQAGSWKVFRQLMPNEGDFEYYTSVLRDNMVPLIKWVITGEGDHENITDEETQIANYIFIRRREINKNEFYYADDYIDKLLRYMEENKSPGSPFSWTYPSKNRGKRIQLKMPVL